MLANPNATNLFVRVAVTGEVNVVALGPGASDRLPVTLEASFSGEDRQYDLLAYAPLSWWGNSTTLASLVAQGLIQVDLVAAGSANGAVVQDPLPAATTPVVTQTINLATDKVVRYDIMEVVGGTNQRLTDFTSSTLSVVGSVATPGTTLEVVLYNLDLRVVVAILQFTATTPTLKSAALIPIPTGQRTYELRARVVDGLDTNADIGMITFAGIQTTKRI